MYYHRQSMTAFLANPRTASRSVAAALRKIGFTMEGSHHSGLDDRPVRRSFCVVRHHCDTLISWGEHLRKPVRDEKSLRWLLDNMEHQNLYPEWELGRRLFPWAESCDIPLRLEGGLWDGVGLELWEAGLVTQIATFEFPTPHLGRSDRPRVGDVFTTLPMLEMVADQYGDEMERLGYEIVIEAPRMVP